MKRRLEQGSKKGSFSFLGDLLKHFQVVFDVLYNNLPLKNKINVTKYKVLVQFVACLPKHSKNI